MAGNTAVNKSRNIAIMLLELRRHFNTCKECRGAMDVADYDRMCGFTKIKLVAVARRWDANIGMRLKAHRSGEPYAYQCPDLSKHGEAYAMAAEPVMITGVQGMII
jgi:hypothetical protein